MTTPNGAPAVGGPPPESCHTIVYLGTGMMLAFDEEATVVADRVDAFLINSSAGNFLELHYDRRPFFLSRKEAEIIFHIQPIARVAVAKL